MIKQIFYKSIILQESTQNYFEKGLNRKKA